ncbi:hypothetical protein FGRMN_8356, partial [Fusarium graminum]
MMTSTNITDEQRQQSRDTLTPECEPAIISRAYRSLFPSPVIVIDDSDDGGSANDSDSTNSTGTFDVYIGIVIDQQDVDFVLVEHILRDQTTGAITFRGVPFLRACHMSARLPAKPNEVCMVVHWDQDTGCQELVDISPPDIQNSLPLIITNATYPVFNKHHFHPDFPDRRGCRKKQVEASLARIQAHEVDDERYRVSQQVLSNRWRNVTIKGGSYEPERESDAYDIDLDMETAPRETQSRGQKYTMFDACCGAGGVSRGALMAGFKVQSAVDMAPEVWLTYEANFPDTDLFRMPLDKFITHRPQTKVDVLHFSPPCQYFSPAHTHNSPNDDNNIFAMFGGNQLLHVLRPRIATVEQTLGLAFPSHAVYFHSLIGDFTQHGYSVRWKVVNLATWGAAQERKRLIIIAAAPGEALPPFPNPTHGQGPGLQPFNSIFRVLSSLKEGDDLHDLDHVQS